MLTFNDFRNKAIQIWRAEDVAAHAPKVEVDMQAGDRLILFPGDLYAAVQPIGPYRTKIGSKTLTRSSKTLIARPLYALRYVHENGIGDLMRHITYGVNSTPLIGDGLRQLAAAIGIEEIDEQLLELTIRMHNNASPQRLTTMEDLSMWLLTELPGWYKTPKTERS